MVLGGAGTGDAQEGQRGNGRPCRAVAPLALRHRRSGTGRGGRATGPRRMTAPWLTSWIEAQDLGNGCGTARRTGRERGGRRLGMADRGEKLARLLAAMAATPRIGWTTAARRAVRDSRRRPATSSVGCCVTRTGANRTGSCWARTSPMTSYGRGWSSARMAPGTSTCGRSRDTCSSEPRIRLRSWWSLIWRG